MVPTHTGLLPAPGPGSLSSHCQAPRRLGSELHCAQPRPTRYGLAVHLASVPDGLPLLENAVVPVGSSCAHAARDRLQAGTVEARSFSAPPKATHFRAKVVCTIVVAVTVALAGFEPGFDEPIEPASPGPVHIDILEIRLAPLSVLDVRLEWHRGTLPSLHSPRTVALADHVRAGTPPGAFGPLAAPHLPALMFVVGVALACLLAGEAQASAVNLGRKEQPLRTIPTSTGLLATLLGSVTRKAQKALAMTRKAQKAVLGRKLEAYFFAWRHAAV